MACPGGKPENLRPSKPGEVRNPLGRNQFSYRADAERHMAEWCKVHGRELIERLLEDAKKGRGYAMKLALDRILPAVQHHDIAINEASDLGIDDRLAAVIRARKGNGADPEPLDPRSEGDH